MSYELQHAHGEGDRNEEVVRRQNPLCPPHHEVTVGSSESSRFHHRNHQNEAGEDDKPTHRGVAELEPLEMGRHALAKPD